MINNAFAGSNRAEYQRCVCVLMYLYSCLGEFSSLSELFSGVYIGVMGAFESSLQLLQLLGCERGPTAPLFPL